MKLNAIWCLLLVLLGILCVLALLAGILDWSIKQYSYIPLSILGLLMAGKILMWDWNEKKANSKDKSFKLRK